MSGTEIARHLGTFITRISRRVTPVERLDLVSAGVLQSTFVATFGGGARAFVKVGAPEQRPRLRAEARGLEALRDAGAARVPQVWLTGGEAQHYFLVLEYLELQPGDASAHARLGRELAALHRVTGAQFGFERDNFIGATPQANRCSDHWPAFFREQRLLPQLALAAGRPAARAWAGRGELLAGALEGFFTGHRPPPSLLHGDLWSGNAGFLAGGIPVLYDPAVYYGDREADLAMTELFGGFAPDFYAAYRDAWPLEPGYAVRKDLYNLYHLINHFNLFGGAYGAQAASQIDRLLAAVR
jgi:fructosamine-3-kinase